MKCSEVIEILGKLAPESCACDWDNPGLLAGRSDKEVKKIYIALDATDQVVDAAIKAGADMLLTHHPLIFKAIKKVNDQNFITRRLVKLIQADISYYAMHTNFEGYRAVRVYGRYGNKWKFCGIWYWKNRKPGGKADCKSTGRKSKAGF